MKTIRSRILQLVFIPILLLIILGIIASSVLQIHLEVFHYGVLIGVLVAAALIIIVSWIRAFLLANI